MTAPLAEIIDLAQRAWPAVFGVPVGVLLVKWWGHSRAVQSHSDDVALQAAGDFRAELAVLRTEVANVRREADLERKACDAMVASLRHELRTVETSFEALILAIELAPEKAGEAVARIKARRTDKAKEQEGAA